MRVATFLALLLLSTSSAAGEQAFLELDEGQRFWFFEGAFRTAAHLIALSDKAKGDCAANWWLSGDRDAKRQLIEKTIRANPGRSETTIILGLLTKACGPLIAKSVNGKLTTSALPSQVANQACGGCTDTQRRGEAEF